MSKLVESIKWLLVLMLCIIQPIAAFAQRSTGDEFVEKLVSWQENDITRVQVSLDREYEYVELLVSADEQVEQAEFNDTDRMSVSVSGGGYAPLIQIKAYQQDELVNSTLYQLTVNTDEQISDNGELQVDKSDWEKQPAKKEQNDVQLVSAEKIRSQEEVQEGDEQFAQAIGKKRTTKKSPSSKAFLNIPSYEIEPNDTFEKADWLFIDKDAYGKIGKPGDVDFWKLKMPSDKDGQLRVWLGEIPQGQDYNLYAYNSDRKEIGRSERGKGMDELIEGITEERGAWVYFSVKSADNTSFDKNRYYHLRVAFIQSDSPVKPDEYEPNNTPSQATPIIPGKEMIGNIHDIKDQDFYLLPIVHASTIELTLTEITGGLDVDLFLLDSNLKQVAKSTNARSADEKIVYNGDPGTYYVKVELGKKVVPKENSYKLMAKVNVIPVILIPGVGGSQLALDSGGVTWINPADILRNDPLVVNLSLLPTSKGSTAVKSKYGVKISPVRSNFGIDGISNITTNDMDSGLQYRDMIGDLEQQGYQIGKTLFGFPYDWRLDLREHHRDLTTAINQALTLSGAKKVQIIAHSMGGLLIKDYLLTDRSREKYVDKIVTIGTPFLGAGKGAKALVQGYNFDIIYLSIKAGLSIAENAPSVYLLAPSETYDKKMLSTTGRTTYAYIDRTNKFNNLPYSSLTKLYPNQALVSLGKTRHDAWDGKFPAVRQYHIVGDNVSTILGINRWQEYKGYMPDQYIEYVMAFGDGTVPLMSAINTGDPNAKIFYAKTTGHLEMLKEVPVREKTLQLLNGEIDGAVNGIETKPHFSKEKNLTAYSLTGEQGNFKGVTIEISNKETNEYGTIAFTDEGELDPERTSKNLVYNEAQLSGENYNIQFYIDKDNDAVININGLSQNIVLSSYETNSKGTKNQILYSNEKNVGKRNQLKIVQNKSTPKVFNQGKELKSVKINVE